MAWAVRVGGSALDVLRRLGRDLGQHLLQRRRLLDAALLGEAAADALERVGEPRLVHRLHQIVDRVRLEGAQRMVRISGDEDEQRRLHLHQALDHREAVEARHLDVEEDEIGLVGLDRADRLAAVRAGVDDLDILMRLEAELQPLDGERFVVDQDGAYGHFGSSVSI